MSMEDDIGSPDSKVDGRALQDLIGTAAETLQQRHGIADGLFAAMTAIWASAVTLHVTARIASGDPFNEDDFVETARAVWRQCMRKGVIAKQAAVAKVAMAAIAAEVTQAPQRTTAPCCCPKCTARKQSVH